MLLKTDLALWTSAMVNLTLANVSPIHRQPLKSKFAIEALRIVNELQEENPKKEAFWIAEYARLKKAAEGCLERAQKEEREHQQAVEAKEAGGIQDLMQGLELEGTVSSGPELPGSNDDPIRWVSVGAEEIAGEVSESVGVEGAFSVFPRAIDVDEGSHDGGGSGGSNGGDNGGGKTSSTPESMRSEASKTEDVQREAGDEVGHHAKITSLGTKLGPGLPTPPQSSQ